jgi:hypothetical protein
MAKPGEVPYMLDQKANPQGVGAACEADRDALWFDSPT